MRPSLCGKCPYYFLNFFKNSLYVVKYDNENNKEIPNSFFFCFQMDRAYYNWDIFFFKINKRASSFVREMRALFEITFE